MAIKIVGLTTFLFITATHSVFAADQGQWKYSTGIDYSSGDYGGDPVDTDIIYLPFTAAYKQDQWTLKATVPLLQIEGAGTVVGAGDGGVVVGDSSATASKESGLGDIWLSASYSVDSVPADLLYLDLALKVKLPTADEDKNLGTGEVDYTLQADVFKSLGKLTPFATLAYKVKGEPSGSQLDNVIFVSVGSDYRLSDTRNVGASMDFQQASSNGADDSLELFAYLSQKLNKQWSLTLYGYKGLKDGSPDLGAGFQVSYKPKRGW